MSPLFRFSQYGARPPLSIVGLLTVASERITKACNRPGAAKTTLVLHISKASD